MQMYSCQAAQMETTYVTKLGVPEHPCTQLPTKCTSRDGIIKACGDGFIQLVEAQSLRMATL